MLLQIDFNLTLFLQAVFCDFLTMFYDDKAKVIILWKLTRIGVLVNFILTKMFNDADKIFKASDVDWKVPLNLKVI